MKISLKIFIIITLSALCIALLMIMAVRIFLIQNLLNTEDELINENFKSLIVIVDKEITSIKSIAKDWSLWDDTYEFISDHNQEYINSNLQDTTFPILKLNIMIYVNKKGEIVYAKGYDLDQSMEVPLNDDLLKQIKKNNILLSHTGINDIVSGLLITSGKSMIIVSSPISTTDEKSPVNGSLIIGRYINADFMEYLEKITGHNVVISANDAVTENNNENNQIKVDKQYLELSKIVIQKNPDIISGTSLLKDIYGYSNISITVKMSRDVYKNGINDLKFFIIIFMLGLLLIILICIFVLDKTVIKRLQILNKFVQKVGKDQNVSSRINLSGTDEIAGLALATNQMLYEIETAYQDIQKAEERFRLIMEATNDGFWDLNITSMELYISSQWLSYMGDEALSKKEQYDKYIGAVNEEGFDLNKIIQACIQGNREYLYEEYSILKQIGERIWVLNRGKVVEHDESGKPVRLVGTFSDITKKKEIEQEIYSLSYIDKLTGLTNRAYMEKSLEEMDQCKDGKYTILMGDLNGLKYTNDVFGHHKGDELLCCMADILRNCCSNDDIITRWGGDEFLILIKNKTKDYTQELIRNIKLKCEKIEEFAINVNIALGSAEKDINNKNKDEVIKKAEERMYRNKILEKGSARNSTLLSLERALFERSRETEEHAVRLRHMCVKMGEAMGLSQDELDELSLLAMLHDIGKIAIPDHILMKPDKLTNEEWEVMKTHTDIGYRIAISTPELAHIAESIRYHHERYDGKGYPRGLKGKNIPRMSRVLNIVDSYDVMTHERPYKSKLNPSEAVNELTVNAGKQFDPELVHLFIITILDTK